MLNVCNSCYQTNIACEACGGTGVVTPKSPQEAVPPLSVQDFATEQFPLHASAIPDLVKCTLRSTMIHLFGREDSSGAAADTGSLTHVAVASWHRNKDITKAIEEMRAAQERYKQGDLAEATALFFQYSRDPANINAVIAQHDGRPLIEHGGKIRITPSETDQTKKEIVIVGTLDQVRENNGRLEVWDLKTSKKPPSDQLNMYLYQIAAYSLMASSLLKKTVRMGGLICARQYPKDAIVPFFNRASDISTIIHGIRQAVATVRMGIPYPGPGEHCRYCPLSSTAECIPALQRISTTLHKIREPRS